MKIIWPAYFLGACLSLFVAQIGRLRTFIPNEQFSVMARALMSCAGICFALLCIWGSLRSWKTLSSNLQAMPLRSTALKRFFEITGAFLPRKFRKQVFEHSANDLLLDWAEAPSPNSNSVFQHGTLIWKIFLLLTHTLLVGVKEASGLAALVALLSKFLGK